MIIQEWRQTGATADTHTFVGVGHRGTYEIRLNPYGMGDPADPVFRVELFLNGIKIGSAFNFDHARQIAEQSDNGYDRDWRA